MHSKTLIRPMSSRSISQRKILETLDENLAFS